MLRQRDIMHIPVTPSLAADGGGRIGVSMAPNATVVRKAAKGPRQALRLAGAEFVRLASIVTNGGSPVHLARTDTGHMRAHEGYCIGALARGCPHASAPTCAKTSD